MAEKIAEVGESALDLVASKIPEGDAWKERMLQKSSLVTDQVLTGLQNVNDILSAPEIREEARVFADNLGELTVLFADRLEAPLKQALSKLQLSVDEIMAAVLSGSIKIGTDAMAAVPFAGAVVEMGKISNDAANSAERASTALQDMVDTTSNLYYETKDILEQSAREFLEKHRESTEIHNRIPFSFTKNEKSLDGKERINDSGENKFEPISTPSSFSHSGISELSAGV